MLVAGLFLFAAAVVVGIAGTSANTGSEHQLVGGFGIFGYHVHGSAGKLFLAGIVIGAAGVLGFIMVAEGLRRNAALRRELFRFRRDARARRRAVATAPPAAEPTAAKRVLVRTAPTSSGNTSAADSATDADADTKATSSAERSAKRRSLRDWRISRSAG